MSFSGQVNIILIKNRGQSSNLAYTLILFAPRFWSSGEILLAAMEVSMFWLPYYCRLHWCGHTESHNLVLHSLFPNSHNRTVLCRRRKYLAVRVKLPPQLLLPLSWHKTIVKEGNFHVGHNTMDSGSKDRGRGTVVMTHSRFPLLVLAFSWLLEVLFRLRGRTKRKVPLCRTKDTVEIICKNALDFFLILQNL